MLDFLYSDHERVAALMSQLEGVGSLVGYERTSEKETEKGNEIGGSLEIISGKHRRSQSLNRQLRQEYDPLWINSKRLVEAVAQRKPSPSYDYGKLLTVRGSLLCVDQGLFNNLLKSPSIIDQIASGIDNEGSELGKARNPKAQRNEKRALADIVREFVQSLPLGVIFILFTERDAFWFNVKREYLQLQSLDIPLKFPVQIGGTWHVTGILDALPNDYTAALTDQLIAFDNRLVLTQTFSIISQVIAPLVGLFGRPADAYGINPITIHREITF